MSLIQEEQPDSSSNNNNFRLSQDDADIPLKQQQKERKDDDDDHHQEEQENDNDNNSNSDDEDEEEDEEAERQKEKEQFRFKTWRKHMRDVYKICMHTELTWPTRSVQFLPYMTSTRPTSTTTTATSSSPNECQHKSQTVLVGTTTNGNEQCFLKLLSLDLPSGPAPPPSSSSNIDPELGEVGGYGYAPRYVDFTVKARFFHNGDVVRARYMPSNPNVFLTASSDGNCYLFDYARMTQSGPPNYPKRPLLPLPPEQTGKGGNPTPKQERELSIYSKKCKEQEKWDEDTKGTGQHRFCLKQQQQQQEEGNNNSNNKPTCCEWNFLDNEGLAAAGFEDGSICLWHLGIAANTANNNDASSTSSVVNQYCSPSKTQKNVTDLFPTATLKLPREVTDVQFSCCDENVLSASCFDGNVRIWDLRSISGATTTSSTTTTSESNNNDNEDSSSSTSNKNTNNSPTIIFPATATTQNNSNNNNKQENLKSTSIAWSLFDPNICAVGYSSGVTKIWDKRKPDCPVLSFSSHKKDCEITTLQWCPHDKNVLASGSEDCNVVWTDVSNEKCLFVHCGHPKTVSDMAWCWQDSFAGMMVSCDDSSVVAWSPRSHLLQNFD